MSDYSLRRARPFEKLEPQDVITMVRLLATLRLPKKPLVKSRYEERGRHFDATLAFLKSIGWVNESPYTLTLTDSSLSSLQWPADITTGRRIIEAILKSRTPYRTQLCQFLAQFETNGDSIVHAPGGETRVKESAIRNFLIALGIVSLRRRTNDYVLQNDAIDLWMRARVRYGRSTKTKLLLKLQERDQLGFDTECAVVEYERRRLGPEWASAVEHIAREHPLANYDIESVTLVRGKPNPRFIEVKAVSPVSFRFFWSKPEVETARMLGASYFLYLVPVDSTRRANVYAMRIVENAYTSVYENPSKWDIESDVVVCQPHSAPRS
jgi:hypothetical protein